MADQNLSAGPKLKIEKIYLKDLSLENPGAPQSFAATQETPQVEVGLRSRGEQLDQNLFECVLTVTVTARVGEKTLFLVEAAQGGLFRIEGCRFRISSRFSASIVRTCSSRMCARPSRMPCCAPDFLRFTSTRSISKASINSSSRARSSRRWRRRRSSA